MTEIKIQGRRPKDKRWHDAPYDIQDDARAERLIAWLRHHFKAVQFRIVRQEIVSEGQ